MKRSNVIILIVVLVAAAAVVAAIMMGGKKKDHDMNMNSSGSSPSSSSQAPATTNPVAAESVTIQNFAFSPASITVKVGTKVTWTNKDSVAHTVTADNASSNAPDSSRIAQNESFSFTFTKAGTYAYHCTPHPNMHGTVVVTE